VKKSPLDEPIEVPPPTPLAERARSFWDEPHLAPKELPERMSAEELVAWYSFHIRDPDVPLALRAKLADSLAAILRLTGQQGPTVVAFGAANAAAPNKAEARALVAKLSERFRRLPGATAPTVAPEEPQGAVIDLRKPRP